MRWISCDYSDTYMYVKKTVTIPNIATAGVDANNANKKVMFEKCAPFTKRINKINNAQ